MSAIISGKCKKCGGSYYLSFGHPKWFDDRMRHAKDNPIYDSFAQLAKTRLCTSCGKSHYAKFAADWRKHSSTQSIAPTQGANTHGHRSAQQPRRQKV